MDPSPQFLPPNWSPVCNQKPVLYSPPPVLVDSMRTPQIRMESVQSLQGVHMDSTDTVKKKKNAWSLCGLRVERQNYYYINYLIINKTT
jgi:hypothetical protein